MPHKDPAVHKAYHVAYREKHRLLTREKQKKYAGKGKSAKWRASHPGYFDAKQKEYYLADPEKFNARGKKHRGKARAFLDAVKLHYGCQNPKCQTVGDLPSCCLEFHHVIRADKSFAVGKAGAFKLNVVAQEIRKCTVVCSNCHARITHLGLDANHFQKCNVDDEGHIMQPLIHLA